MAVSGAVAFALVWIYVAWWPTAYLTDTYLHWTVQQQRLAACTLGDVAVFGDSKAQAAIAPRVMHVSVINLATAGTSPVETYYAVEQAMRCPHLPRVVILTHGAKTFAGMTGFWNQDSREGILTAEQRREVEDEAARLHDKVSIDRTPDDGLAPFARNWLYTQHFPPLAFPSLLNSALFMRISHNRDVMRGDRETLGHALHGTANGSAELGEEAELDGFHAAPLMNSYFRRTLTLLNTHGIDVLYLDLPLNKATYDKIDPSMRAAFATYLRAATGPDSRFHVLGQPMPCWPNAFFGDRAHMNARGATAFSKDLDRVLTALLAGMPAPDMLDRCNVPPPGG